MNLQILVQMCNQVHLRPAATSPTRRPAAWIPPAPRYRSSPWPATSWTSSSSPSVGQADRRLLDRGLVQQHGVRRRPEGHEAVIAGYPADQAAVAGVDQGGDDSLGD